MDIQCRGCAALLAQRRKPETIFGHTSCLASNLELHIEFPQVEVRRAHVSDERRRHTPASLVTCEILGACGFRQSAQTSPEVQFPAEAKARLCIAHVRADAGGYKSIRANLRVSI